MKGRASIVWKAGLSLAILSVLAARTDVRHIGALLASIRGSTIACALFLILLQTIVTAYRWVAVMRGVGISLQLWPAVQALFASLFINQCLPSYVGGDAYRVYWMYREGQPFAKAIRGVLIDRVGALMALVVMMAISLPRLFQRFHDPTAETAMVVVAGAGILGSLAFFASDALPAWDRFPMLLQLRELSRAARGVLLRGRTALVVNPLALLVHALGAAIMAVFAADLGMPLTLLDCLLLIPPITLLSAIPISVSGWGVREGVMVGALGVMGIGADQALALSVLMGFALLANGLLGLIPLTFGGDRFVAERVRDTESAPVDGTTP